MVKTLNAKGFGHFMKIFDTSGDGTVYVFFSGSKGEDGKSWCPDCVVAQPVVDKYLKELTDDVTYIYCEVGEREYWKDKTNDFRTNDRLRLTGVPTLMKMGSPKRLVEADCANEELVAMFFEED